ncbi:ChlI component of cobalt chelatase [Cutibacterium acnes JCM 18909]|nr:ChlI component of cobalt chelatase [Cutibacterium acnes JCM 18909]
MRTLALGTTEDRLVGGLDLEATLVAGRPVLQPGLLSEVDGGVLYIDEVNFLDDHLVDLVIDACAGIVRVEREGLTASLPSRFVLVGTMNRGGGTASAVVGPVRTVHRRARRVRPGRPG